ncbi:MAG: DUF1385 domain-containing protein [Candidatus Sericytochromatia bacterium]|nr:DUF1385 domain-containing protein [Candidatus Sericytochromatia bacterium]
MRRYGLVPWLAAEGAVTEADARPAIDPVGGQAVLEGVMMRAADGVGLAVRRNDGQIHAEFHPYVSLRKRVVCFGWPLLRGVVAMVESLRLGVRMLDRSVEIATGERAGRAESLSSLGVGLLLAVALFMVLPAWVYGWTPDTWHALARAGVEGAVRLGVFVAYVVILGRQADVASLYAYHGAEHQVIHAYEQGLGETVEAARSQSPRHPRCGTSFLFLTAVVGIFVFAWIPRPEGLAGGMGLAWRVGAKLTLLPFVAAVSFELIRAAGANAVGAARLWGRVASWLSSPGQALQGLTTRRAADDQIEVALAALAVARRGA